MARTVKVAVVGSGLAGLTAAYLLTKPSESHAEVQFDVHLFEKARIFFGLTVRWPV
jgi:protoporphyrinogen oxidase